MVKNSCSLLSSSFLLLRQGHPLDHLGPLHDHRGGLLSVRHGFLLCRLYLLDLQIRLIAISLGFEWGI